MLGGLGGGVTVNGALPVLPVPPLVEVTLPVTLVMAPAVVLGPSTGMAQLPLAGMLAPLRGAAGSPAVCPGLSGPPRPDPPVFGGASTTTVEVDRVAGAGGVVTSTGMAQLPLAGMLGPLRVTAVSPAV